jgi:pullulanase
MNTAVDPNIKMATQLNARLTPNFAYFSDTIRDLLAGRNGETLGFVSGSCGQEEPLARCFTAKTSWCPKPTQTVNYASCHDNYTLFDKLSISRKDASRADLIRMNKLAAAIYMTAQGIPFIHAGEEFLREKLNQNHVRVENSYNAPDFVNKIRWDVLDDIEHSDVVDYYRGLVAFRKAHPALRLASADEVTDLVTYKWITNEVVLFEINGKPVIDGETAACIYVIFNATQKTQTIDLSRAEINFDALNVYIDDVSAGTKPLRTITQPKLEIAPISALVMTKE